MSLVRAAADLLGPLLGCPYFPDASFEGCDVIFEGPVLKQSRHLHAWRSRWMVLTKSHLLTFEEHSDFHDGEGDPTECVPISSVINVIRRSTNEVEVCIADRSNIKLRCMSTAIGGVAQDSKVAANHVANALLQLLQQRRAKQDVLSSQSLLLPIRSRTVTVQ
mmetsp:Transcript_25427/g.59178  ORF Transcript_25427/g.59178 Transcript_25427/m.59178 type:complete len:163 (-) Transcript_25427:180-668(-)